MDTDLLIDSIDVIKYKDIINYKKEEKENIIVEEMTLKEKINGFDKGKYISITFDNIDINLSSIFSDALKKFYKKKYKNILVCGLGNRNIICDALGPLSLEKILSPRLKTLEPSVYGLTGIDSLKHINAVKSIVKPDLIILIDSLKTTYINRLLKNIQITSSSLIRGENKINKETFNCDTIMIGIPTIINGSSINNDIEKTYFTDKDIDTKIKLLSYIISNGINNIF